MPANDPITPIMPTGSGVADLEIAREHDALVEDANAADAATVVGPETDAQSEAHPS